MFVGIGFACPPVVLPPLLDHFQAKMNVSLVASPEAAVSDQAVQECSLGFSVDNPPVFSQSWGDRKTSSSSGWRSRTSRR